MNSDERRRNQRVACRIPVKMRAGSFVGRGVITNLSEDGLFIEISSSLPAGMQAAVRFKHPDHGRTLTTTGIVARHVRGGNGRSGGLGLYLPEPLSSHTKERRTVPRESVDFGVELKLDGHVSFCRAVDLSRDGIGLKMQTDVRLARLLRPGTRVELRYRDPATGEVRRRDVVVARNIRARLGVAFADSPVAATIDGSRLTSSGVWSLDEMVGTRASQELEMRALLRQVVWRSPQHHGTGRLAVAGPDNLVVRCHQAVPAERTRVGVTLRPTGESAATCVNLQLAVTGSGHGYIAGSEPGFEGRIVRFADPRSESRYERLVQWMRR